eukprot:7201148-Prymnesium_polylepis.1
MDTSCLPVEWGATPTGLKRSQQRPLLHQKVAKQWRTETKRGLKARLQRKRKKRTANTDRSLRSHAFYVCVSLFVTPSNLACHICPHP